MKRMKQIKFFKRALLLVALVSGVSVSWADNVNIPQNMGDYIPISTDGGSTFCSYIDGTQINRQNNLAVGSTYYTIGCENNQNVVINIHAKATVAGDYVFGFKTGANNGAASTLNITITKSGESPVTVATGEAVTTNGNWDPTVEHKFYLSGLEENGEYTISIAATKTSGNYCGNFGQFYFHTVSQYPTWPTDGSTTIDLSSGTYYNSMYNSDGVISGLDNGGYMDNILLNNSTEGYYTLKFNVKDYKAEGTLTATIYNMASGEAEITTEALAITSTGDKTIHLGKSLTTGLKRLRFDFTGTKESGTIFNYRNVTFQLNSYDALPIYGTAVLDLSKGSMTSSSNPRYSSNSGTNNEISYIYNGGYADDFYVVISGNETAYYDLRTTTSSYNKHEGTFKVTITDMATNTVEVNAQESETITSNGQSIIMPLTTALKPGLKKIRFDFVKDGESAWLYNLKDICFYKRSLNENYNYTPVAATDVDVVLTRSITAGNWSTIVLPFDLASDKITTVFGEGASVAELTDGDANTLNFTTTLTDSKMKANQPYAIKVASNFTTATISGVTIESATPTQSLTNWNFVGNYSTPATIPTGSYYFKSNKLYQAGTGTHSIKPFRAYFTPKGSSAPALNFVVDGETTGIDATLVNSEKVNSEVYDLQGRRVAQPTKGLYIVNGKKVVIK